MATERIVTVRCPVEVDVEAVLALVNEAELVRRRGLRAFEANPARARDRLTAPDAFFAVAENGDQGGPIGVAVGMHGREDAGAGPAIPGLGHISMVAVRPECWGQGIGRHLVQELISEIRRRGYGRAQLFTQADNTRAQRLYTGLGFRPTGEVAVSDEGEGIVQYLLTSLPDPSP